MDAPATYLHWGFILISVSNAALIAGMVLLFVLVLLLPFPGHAERNEEERDES